jgi:hypothetical protein
MPEVGVVHRQLFNVELCNERANETRVLHRYTTEMICMRDFN